MIALAAIGLALGLADLVAGGMSGQPASVSRALLGWAIVGVAMVALTVLADGTAAAWTLTGSTLLLSGLWMCWRLDSDRRRPGLAVVAHLALLALAVVLAPTLPVGVPQGLVRWVERHPLPLVADIGTERLLGGLAAFVLLGATANGMVRAVLQAAGTPLQVGETTLRGGRLIGILERWLIFSLALAGQPTAAALVVSAKSLIRFPELQRQGAKDDPRPASRDGHGAGGDDPGDDDGASRVPEEIDLVTEYFLLGSLMSWSLALFPALLLAPPRIS